ncbi:EAL domain-containing protein [Colwellia asteriadis]|uniref:EAL domain-containing protein n=1 Tax=Colwellia asteriadis TaxID=517723 RepID=UPI0031DFA028
MALLPYFVIAALITLIKTVLLNLSLLDENHLLISTLSFGSEVISQLFPAAVVISFSYFLSKNLGVNTIVGSILALTNFSIHAQYIRKAPEHFILMPDSASVYSLIIPAISCYLLKLFIGLCRPIFSEMPSISLFLRKHLLLITPFTLSFLSLFLLMPIIDLVGHEFSSFLLPKFESAANTSQMLWRMWIIHGLWFFGIHGDNAFHVFVNASILGNDIVPGLNNKNFYDVFVLLGGTGCFWGLILAVLIRRVKSHEQAIIKISLPFTLFNFCEIIIFALPIILNPIYLIPFFLAPTFNFLLSYQLLTAEVFTVSSVEMSWMTPIFFNAWLLSENTMLVLYQVLLIVCNTLIYYPFVKLSQEKYSPYTAVDKLERTLGISSQIDQDNENIFIKHQQKNKSSLKALNNVLTDLANSDLELHYQPQINLKNNQIYGYEALLRLRKADGKLYGPYFLDILNDHKLGHIVDNWVIDQVAIDLQYWNTQKFYPNISLNLNPNILYKRHNIDNICAKFADFSEQVKLEVVESSYLEKTDIVIEHLSLLAAQGIQTAIDDFGTGYSSLSMLGTLPIEIAKLDRQFLQGCETQSGKILYRHITTLFHQLGYTVIAEGIETKAELDWVNSLNIEVAQGWLYSAAIPREEVLLYQKHWKSTNSNPSA